MGGTTTNFITGWDFVARIVPYNVRFEFRSLDGLFSGKLTQNLG